MNTKEFIEKSKLIHGDKYDYNKAVYTNPKEKICIICPTHGEFYQKPYNHLNGQGCSKCRYEMLSSKYKKTTKQFIEDAKKVHGDKYDYSLFMDDNFVFNNTMEKMPVICKKHGVYLLILIVLFYPYFFCKVKL